MLYQKSVNKLLIFVNNAKKSVKLKKDKTDCIALKKVYSFDSIILKLQYILKY